MSRLDARLAEDRALRDAALGLFKADLALVRADLKERGVGARVGARVGGATMDMLDEAVDYTQANKGKVAAAVAAVVLWFARGPIVDAVEGLLADEEPGAAGDRSDDDR